MKRTRSYTIAAILQLLLSLAAIGLSLPDIARGANEVNQAPDTIPYAALMMSLIIGVLGLVSAYGVWRVQKWGVILTIILRAVDGLTSLPGVAFGPTPMLQFLATISVVLAIVVIYLLLRREVDATEMDVVYLPEERSLHAMPSLKADQHGVAMVAEESATTGQAGADNGG